ncbi:MAG TPA: hypothetical protein VEF04_15715, partial [Blastocatellia bacterium]|nr:hypothetical protein [Blastocatellia bacterium]
MALQECRVLFSRLNSSLSANARVQLLRSLSFDPHLPVPQKHFGVDERHQVSQALTYLAELYERGQRDALHSAGRAVRAISDPLQREIAISFISISSCKDIFALDGPLDYETDAELMVPVALRGDLNHLASLIDNALLGVSRQNVLKALVGQCGLSRVRLQAAQEVRDGIRELHDAGHLRWLVDRVIVAVNDDDVRASLQLMIRSSRVAL